MANTVIVEKPGGVVEGVHCRLFEVFALEKEKRQVGICMKPAGKSIAFYGTNGNGDVLRGLLADELKAMSEAMELVDMLGDPE